MGLSGTNCPREVLRANIPDNLYGLSTVVRLWTSKAKEDAAQSCPMGLSGETVGSDLQKSDSDKSRLWWLKNKVWIEWKYQGYEQVI